MTTAAAAVQEAAAGAETLAPTAMHSLQKPTNVEHTMLTDLHCQTMCVPWALKTTEQTLQKATTRLRLN